MNDLLLRIKMENSVDDAINKHPLKDIISLEINNQNKEEYNSEFNEMNEIDVSMNDEVIDQEDN